MFFFMKKTASEKGTLILDLKSINALKAKERQAAQVLQVCSLAVLYQKLVKAHIKFVL